MGLLAPGMMQFEVYTRCGRGRRYHGTVPASSSKDAAWFYLSLHPYIKKVLVRPEDSRDKCLVYRRENHPGRRATQGGNHEVSSQA